MNEAQKTDIVHTQTKNTAENQRYKYIHSAILPFLLIRLDIPPHQQDYPAYHTRLLW